LQNTLIKTSKVIPDQLMIFDHGETAPGSPLLQGLLKIIQKTVGRSKNASVYLDTQNTFGQRRSA